MIAIRSATLPVLAACAAIATGCASNYYGAAASRIAVDSLRQAAVGVNIVSFAARQGPVRFRASQSDSIAITLGVGPARGAMGTTRECRLERPPTIRLTRQDQTARIAVDGPLSDECVTDWEITVPARSRVEAEVVAGTLTVEGTIGGVGLKTSAGNVVIRVTAGPVTANTENGRIELTYESDTYGAVDAKTQVGSIELFVGGRSLSHQRQPGSGDELRLSGSTENAIRLTVNVGGIAVRLGGPR